MTSLVRRWLVQLTPVEGGMDWAVTAGTRSVQGRTLGTEADAWRDVQAVIEQLRDEGAR